MKLIFTLGIYLLVFNNQLFTQVDNIEIQRIDNGEIEIAYANWWGYNDIDTTLCLQSAINSKAKIIIIPNIGPWITQPLFLRTGQTLILENSTEMIAKSGEYKGIRDCLLNMEDVGNIKIIGNNAKIIMNQDDYVQPYYEKSESRHAIRIKGCYNIEISGLFIQKSGGDGIFIGRSNKNLASSNIKIENCIINQNYRQGISITSVDGLIVENTKIMNTKGTFPQAGIDFEPNAGFEVLKNILIQNCEFNNNMGANLLFVTKNLSSNTLNKSISIDINNCSFTNIFSYNVYIDAFGKNLAGYIRFFNCIVDGTTKRSLFIKERNNNIEVIMDLKNKNK